jgi:hypothetical protein
VISGATVTFNAMRQLPWGRTKGGSPLFLLRGLRPAGIPAWNSRRRTIDTTRRGDTIAIAGHGTGEAPPPAFSHRTPPMPLRSVLVFFGLAALIASSLRAEPPSEATLDFLKIKYTRNDAGQIVAVELPRNARDYHLEAILDNPKLIPHITELKAPACRASYQRVKELETLPALTSVNFDGAPSANDYAISLRGVKNLKMLSLVDSGLTNHGLFDLCGALPRLVELDLTGSKIDSFGLAPLAKLDSLEVLRLGRVRTGTPAVDTTEEDIEEGKRGFSYIANLPRLKRVSFEGLYVTNDDLKALACNCHLEEVKFELGGYALPDLRGPDVDTLIYLQECQPSLLLGPKIATYLVRGHVSGDDWILGIDFCTQVQLLRIPKAQLVRLESLRVTEATNLDFLTHLPSLKRLRLWKCAIAPKDLAGIDRAPTVEIVEIFGTKIDITAARILLSIRSVKQLVFSSCEIDETAQVLFDQNTVPGRIRINR